MSKDLSLRPELGPDIDRNVYFTEQWIGGPGDIRWQTRNLTIGEAQQWSRDELERRGGAFDPSDGYPVVEA